MFSIRPIFGIRSDGVWQLDPEMVRMVVANVSA
jgi:hypothetical protein